MTPAARFDTEQQAREALVEAARRLAPADLNAGRAGNLSARWHRGGADGLLITPSGVDYAALDADEIAWLPLAQPADAQPADPTQAPVLAPPALWFGPSPPSSEWRMHAALYAERDEVGGVVHVHSPYATTLACSPRGQAEGIPPFHYMVAVAGGEDVRCAPYLPFGSAELADAALAAMRGRRACLLANHGLLACGPGLGAAFELAVEVEALARIYWQALAIGEPVRLDAAQVAQALAQFGAYRRDGA